MRGKTRLASDGGETRIRDRLFPRSHSRGAFVIEA